MKSSLFNGLNEEDKKELEAEFRSCPRLRAAYKGYLERRIKSLQEEMLNKEPNHESGWALFQASKLAEVRACYKLISHL